MQKMTNSNEFNKTYLSKQTNKLNSMNVKRVPARAAKKTDSPNGYLQTLNTNSSCNFNGPAPAGHNASGILWGQNSQAVLNEKSNRSSQAQFMQGRNINGMKHSLLNSSTLSMDQSELTINKGRQQEPARRLPKQDMSKANARNYSIKLQTNEDLLDSYGIQAVADSNADVEAKKEKRKKQLQKRMEEIEREQNLIETERAQREELAARIEETLKVESYQKTNPFGTSQKLINARLPQVLIQERQNPSHPQLRKGLTQSRSPKTYTRLPQPISDGIQQANETTKDSKHFSSSKGMLAQQRNRSKGYKLDDVQHQNPRSNRQNKYGRQTPESPTYSLDSINSIDQNLQDQIKREIDQKHYESQTTLDFGGSVAKSKLSHQNFGAMLTQDERKISISPNAATYKKSFHRQLTHGRPEPNQNSQLQELQTIKSGQSKQPLNSKRQSPTRTRHDQSVGSGKGLILKVPAGDHDLERSIGSKKRLSQNQFPLTREEREKRCFGLYMQTPYKLMDQNARKRQQRRKKVFLQSTEMKITRTKDDIIMGRTEHIDFMNNSPNNSSALGLIYKQNTTMSSRRSRKSLSNYRTKESFSGKKKKSLSNKKVKSPDVATQEFELNKTKRQKPVKIQTETRRQEAMNDSFEYLGNMFDKQRLDEYKKLQGKTNRGSVPKDKYQTNPVTRNRSTSKEKSKQAGIHFAKPRNGLVEMNQTYLQPQKIGIGSGKVFNVSKGRNMEERASKTSNHLGLDQHKVLKNKSPILAQHDNSKALFRKMSNQTNDKLESHKVRKVSRSPKDPDNQNLSTVHTHSSDECDRSPKIVDLKLKTGRHDSNDNRLSQRYFGESVQAEEEHLCVVEDGQVSTAERPPDTGKKSQLKMQKLPSNELNHHSMVNTQTSPLLVDLGMTTTLQDDSKLQSDFTYGGKHLSHQRNKTVDSVNNTSTQQMTLTLPALVPTYQPYKKSVSLQRTTKRVQTKKQLENSQRHQQHLRQLEYESKQLKLCNIQTTPVFTQTIGYDYKLQDTRPRFLGGQYTSKLNQKVVSKYKFDFSKERDRSAIDSDCKRMLQEKSDLRRKERRLKELEKDFSEQLQKDYLSSILQMRGSNRNNPMQESVHTNDGLRQSKRSVELPSLTEHKTPQKVI